MKIRYEYRTETDDWQKIFIDSEYLPDVVREIVETINKDFETVNINDKTNISIRVNGQVKSFEVGCYAVVNYTVDEIK